jgi:hypothetical protein
LASPRSMDGISPCPNPGACTAVETSCRRPIGAASRSVAARSRASTPALEPQGGSVKGTSSQLILCVEHIHTRLLSGRQESRSRLDRRRARASRGPRTRRRIPACERESLSLRPVVARSGRSGCC